MAFISAAAAVLALQLGTPAVQNNMPEVVQVRGGPCGNGYDVDVYGRCYPNGVIPPQYQAARQGYGYYEPRRGYREEYRRPYYEERRRSYYREY
jgi:hypothetical protein